MNLRGISVTCNYPNDETEANLPQNMTLDELYLRLSKLIRTETEMTSFVVTAAIDRN